MNFAIIIATYMRTDGKTPFYLKRALDSVFNQTYQSFKIYLIGDKYEDAIEFLDIVKDYPKEKIYYENLPYAKERDAYKNDKVVLWHTGGVNAINHALDIALKDGFKYICHLDHDDFWSPDHLEIINEVIEETGADWVCTQSTYIGRGTLPRVTTDQKYIEFLPVPCGLINSSTCINFLTIPIRIRNFLEEEGIELSYPGDADRWKRCATYITDHNLKSYYINRLTCFHEEEGFIMR